MKKIGILVLALVLALGGLGIAYASWNDTITISGNVTTGTLDLSVDNYTGTWFYKVLDTGGSINSTVERAADANELLVAYAVAEEGDTDHDVLVTFDNLFPCVDFVADFDVHYTGSIPANLQVSTLTVTGINPAWVTITGMPTNVQVDQDTTYHVEIHIHVPQPDDGKTGQGLTGTISGNIYAQQWNEPIQ